jgi:glycosyltransferase involved in cell wall biosynthesis
MGLETVHLSVVVPVYNDENALGRCLEALTTSCPPRVEIIVVDDASTDGSAAVATRAAVRLVRLAANVGPAAARNVGARQARGDVLVFVDSDVVVAPGALDQVSRLLDGRRDVAAVFGSYDANPAAPGVVSRYKNLLHHFVHQHGRAEASTFWAGLGAIRRPVFEEVGGFDAGRFRRPSIEDIELGYRLRRAGHRILLDPTLQGTHLKRWTFHSLVRTDVMGRAIPWARLILDSRQPVDDLNLERGQRLSAALVGLAAVCLVFAPFRAGLAVVAGAALLAEIALNRRLYAFFVRRGGVGFASAGVLLHWLYYLYSGLAYVGVWASVRFGRTTSRAGGGQEHAGARADEPSGERADGRGR